MYLKAQLSQIYKMKNNRKSFKKSAPLVHLKDSVCQNLKHLHFHEYVCYIIPTIHEQENQSGFTKNYQLVSFCLTTKQGPHPCQLRQEKLTELMI